MRREFHVRFCEGPGVQFPRATRLVIGFELRDEAERVMAWLHEQMASYGLTLHPDKTRLLSFRRPPASQQSGKGLATFDFLGFTFYWGRSRSGRWCMWCKTRSSRLQRAIRVAAEWCRRHRHLESGGMRRVHLRRCQNIAKRMLVHVAACNLGLLMRTLFGKGTPKGMHAGRKAVAALGTAYMRLTSATWTQVSLRVNRLARLLQPARIAVAA